MNTKRALWTAAAALIIFAAGCFAGGKTYQVTGTVAEVTPTKLVVQKGTEQWEIDLGPETKGTGDLKPGAKVTITYTMSATEIASKPAANETGAASEKFGAQKKEAPAMPAGARPPGH